MLFDKLKKSEKKPGEEKTGKIRNLLHREKNESPLNNSEDFSSAKLTDVEEKDVKVGFTFRRRKTSKIIKFLNENKIRTLLFYTDIHNILRQLEFGLQPINNINLTKDEEYTVWTYLEKPDHLEFELDNSTRHYFWSWVAEQKVDPTQIAVIALDVKALYAATKLDWNFDEKTRRISIYENIAPVVMRWILVKNMQLISRIEKYVKNNNLKVKVFHGEKGNVTDIMSDK